MGPRHYRRLRFTLSHGPLSSAPRSPGRCRLLWPSPRPTACSAAAQRMPSSDMNGPERLRAFLLQGVRLDPSRVMANPKKRAPVVSPGSEPPDSVAASCIGRWSERCDQSHDSVAGPGRKPMAPEPPGAGPSRSKTLFVARERPFACKRTERQHDGHHKRSPSSSCSDECK